MQGDPIIARHYGPGGREHGGGIGRLIGYVVDEAARRGERHLVTDTRGERLSPRSALRFAGAMGRMALDRATAPDRIAHIHMAGRGSTVRKILLCGWARTLGCRHVLHLHDYHYAADYEARPGWQRSLVRAMFAGADAAVVLGDPDRRLAVQRLQADPHRVVVLHNAVPDPGERPAPPPGPPCILFLGRLSERKGVPELLQALARPGMASLPWRAVLAGDGPVEDYRRQAEALGLAGRIEMPGWLDRPATEALCRQADILVLPSHAEGMSMAVLEGMAHGLAVVTTPVGSHPEVLRDGDSGLFVKPGDVQALAEALDRLLSAPDLRRALGARARARFLSDFSMAAYGRQLDRLYAAIGAERAPGSAGEGQRP